jgi:hypothetical protein
MTTPTAPAPTLAADSVGTVETRYLELPDPSTRPAALSYFDLARQYGGGSLTRAFEDVSAQTLLIDAALGTITSCSRRGGRRRSFIACLERVRDRRA